MLSVVALASGAAFAQDQAAPTAQDQATTDDTISSIFTQLDTNKDGAISNEEAQASSVVTRSFAKADANGDGAISKDEFMSSFTAGSKNTPPPAQVPPPPNPQ
jgi:Ca2+-binding EF-hand superfamily protein